MRKILKIFLWINAAVLFVLNLAVQLNVVDAGRLKLTVKEERALAEVCKWKVIDCPGWGTGGYEACLTNGDGNSCTCGQVTRNCDDCG